MAEASPQLTVNEHIVLWQSFIWGLAHKYADTREPNRKDAVADMFGDIVVPALRYRTNYDPAKGSFPNWMAWIAKSRFLYRLARRRRALLTVSLNARAALGDDQDWAGSFPDTHAVDVGDEIDKKSRSEVIDAAIGQLPVEEQEMVRKHYWSDSEERSPNRLPWAETQALANALSCLRPMLERVRDDGDRDVRTHQLLWR